MNGKIQSVRDVTAMISDMQSLEKDLKDVVILRSRLANPASGGFEITYIFAYEGARVEMNANNQNLLPDDNILIIQGFLNKSIRKLKSKMHDIESRYGIVLDSKFVEMIIQPI